MTKKLLMNNYSENGLMPVMDGLICWLDGRDGEFGDTVWKDRSGNGNDATVTNCVWTGKALKTTSDLSEFLVSKEMISGDNDPYTLEVYFSRYATDRPNVAENVIMANSVKEWGYSTSLYIRGNKLFYDVGNQTLVDNSEFNKPYQVAISKVHLTSRKSFVDGNFIQEANGFVVKEISFFGNWGTEKIKGYYYSIRLYNRVLTEEEVKQNYLYEQSIERG